MGANRDLRQAFRVAPKTRVDLAKLDAGDTQGWDKADAQSAIGKHTARLTELQDRLWAEQKHAVLVVLQGIDASGKDGSIRKVMTAFNPQGCYVASFKVPTAEELAHDFLWRIHKKVPGTGEIGIFNRSHYEEVLVVRVHELVPKATWSGRYDLIRDFEKSLTETGTTIVKFFLHIDKEEQRERLQERFDNPQKRWKFSLNDLEERKLWDDYMTAYEDALSQTSSESAPWYVIPANRNWFRDLSIASILASTIEDLNPQYPVPTDLPESLTVE